jgi:acetoin utilization protein AcuC
MQAIFLYNPEVVQFDYGYSHPFRLERLWLTEHLCRQLGLFASGQGEEQGFTPARRDQLLVAHDPVYLDALQAASMGIHAPGLALLGLGSGDNPVFPGLWEYSLQTAGGTLRAAQLLLDGDVGRVFHPGGGLHHALRRRASGFCYINDVVIGIHHLLDAGRRVFYLDLDAHHGDGVERAFYDTPRVLTLSVHQDGRTLFPGSGFPHEAGEGEGTGYAVNVPLLPSMSDDAYLRVWTEVIEPLLGAFRPDVLVTELGADALEGDPLAALALHLRGWWQLLQRITGLGLPWLAIGGGGYDLANAMRAWTLAWGAMIGWEPTDALPPRPAALPGLAARMQWPEDFWSAPARSAWSSPDDDTTAAVIRQVRRQIFPLHGLTA